jgi:hypothetical protein
MASSKSALVSRSRSHSDEKTTASSSSSTSGGSDNNPANDFSTFRAVFKQHNKDYLKLLIKDMNLKTSESLPPPLPNTGQLISGKKVEEILLKSCINESRKSSIGPKTSDALRVESYYSLASCGNNNNNNNNNSSSAHTTSFPNKMLPLNCIITVDTSKARSNAEVLKMCIGELGWQECPDGLNSGCDIIWQSCTSHEGRDQFSNISQSASSRINKFPCKL